MRDPRIYPQAGDVLKLIGQFSPRTVRKVDLGYVWYDYRTYPYEGEELGCGCCVSITSWRKWAAGKVEVLKVAR